MRLVVANQPLWNSVSDHVATSEMLERVGPEEKTATTFLLYQGLGGEFLLDKTRTAYVSPKESKVMVLGSGGVRVSTRDLLSSLVQEAYSQDPQTPAARYLSKHTAKMDHPMKFKEALDFLEKEIKSLQKSSDQALPEDLFSRAYEKLEEEMFDSAAVWPKQTLSKALVRRGWEIRASSPPSAVVKVARDRLQGLGVQLYFALGDKVGTSKFVEIENISRGQSVLHYGSKEDSEGVKFWVTLGSSFTNSPNLLVEVEKSGTVQYSISSSVEGEESELFGKVVDFCDSRWRNVDSQGKTAAGAFQVFEGEARPSGTGGMDVPDRRPWDSFGEDLYSALRDYLRYQKRFLPVLMLLWQDMWNGKTFEFHFRGDRTAVHVKVTGSLEFDASGRPYVSFEMPFSRDGGGASWVELETFFLDEYDTVVECLEEIQPWLFERLENGLRRLVDSPANLETILNTALTPDLLVG